jgi:hypothetical protein
LRNQIKHSYTKLCLLNDKQFKLTFDDMRKLAAYTSTTQTDILVSSSRVWVAKRENKQNSISLLFGSPEIPFAFLCVQLSHETFSDEIISDKLHAEKFF